MGEKERAGFLYLETVAFGAIHDQIDAGEGDVVREGGARVVVEVVPGGEHLRREVVAGGAECFDYRWISPISKGSVRCRLCVRLSLRLDWSVGTLHWGEGKSQGLFSRKRRGGDREGGIPFRAMYFPLADFLAMLALARSFRL